MPRCPMLDPAYYHVGSATLPHPGADSAPPEGSSTPEPPEDHTGPESDPDPAPYAVGGGWYEIEGERVRGKAAAIEALRRR